MSVHESDTLSEPPANHPPSTGEAALAYAKRGWHVFPIWPPTNDGRCACGGDSCNPAKHPLGRLAARGHLDATTDPQIIRRWWTAEPHANIGVACGRISRVVVIDADGNDGQHALADLLDREGEDGSPAVSASGGGGLHLAYTLPVGAYARSSVSEIAPHVDVRGDGASVILPPSRHISGRHYRWDAWPPMPGPVPAWLLRLVAPKPTPLRTGEAATDSCPIPDGQRDIALTRYAGRLRRAGLSEAEIAAALLVMNQDRCQPPLPEAQVAKIARSVSRYPVGPEWRPIETLTSSDGRFTPIRSAGRRR